MKTMMRMLPPNIFCYACINIKNKYLGVAIFAPNIEYCRIVGYKNVMCND